MQNPEAEIDDPKVDDPVDRLLGLRLKPEVQSIHSLKGPDSALPLIEELFRDKMMEIIYFDEDGSVISRSSDTCANVVITKGGGIQVNAKLFGDNTFYISPGDQFLLKDGYQLEFWKPKHFPKHEQQYNYLTVNVQAQILKNE